MLLAQILDPLLVVSPKTWAAGVASGLSFWLRRVALENEKTDALGAPVFFLPRLGHLLWLDPESLFLSGCGLLHQI